jgi:aspartyl-tRNA(Asn)/glutamyl-tRNA(Gln) amidotransferase subunit A
VTKIQSIKSSNPVHYLEASTLAALISASHLSSREVVRAYLDRTEAVNPKINAVVTLMGEAVLKAADAADKAVASGAEIGPPHGVLFSIKDALDTSGVLTQRGSKFFARNIPDKDATAVARFKAAGARPRRRKQRHLLYIDGSFLD